MKTRCNNPNATQYRYYGGRGIKVCERWDSYANFLADMGHAPRDKTLDRINNDGNYEPKNCRWATHQEQRRNRRGVILVTHGGHTKTLTEWAATLGMPFGTLYRRVVISKWAIDDAFSRSLYESPIREAKSPHCPHCGEQLIGWKSPHARNPLK